MSQDSGGSLDPGSHDSSMVITDGNVSVENMIILDDPHAQPPTPNTAQPNTAQPTPKVENLTYPPEHTGPYIVFVESESNSRGLGGVHPMALGRWFYDNKITDIQSICKQGRNRIRVTFTTGTAANSFLGTSFLTEKNLRAFIPTSNVHRIGIIREVALDLSEAEIIQYLQSPCPVVHAQRLSRRKTTDGQVELVPTGTIKVTFQTQHLPSHVAIFNVSLEVQAFVYGPTLCRKCQRYGHTQKNCRAREPRCGKCSLNHETNTCTQVIFLCLHCQDNHQTGSPRCPEQNRQATIKKIMCIENKSYEEAVKLQNPSRPAFNPTLLPQQFPPLPSSPQAPPATLRKRKYVEEHRNPRPSPKPGYDRTAYLNIVQQPNPSTEGPAGPVYRLSREVGIKPFSSTPQTPTRPRTPIPELNKRFATIMEQLGQNVQWRHLIKQLQQDIIQLITHHEDPAMEY